MSKAKLFPRFLLVRFRNFLQYLHIVGVRETVFVEADPPMGLGDFQVLPACLKELFIPFHFKLTNDIVNVLPSSLEVLRLGREYSMPNWVVSSLPQGLKVLDIRFHQEIGDSVAAQIPLSLTHLSLPSNTELSGDFIRKASHLHLTYLDLARNQIISGQDFASLPRTLKHLNLASLSFATSDHVARLPPKLETLELTSLQEMSDESFKHLPRLLTSLNLETATGYSSQAVKYFPQKLTRLNIGITTQLDTTNHGQNHLPPLPSDGSPQPHHQDSIFGINALPKMLTFLAMEKCLSVGILKKKIALPHLTFLSIPKIDQFDETNIHFLPQSLITLNLLHATKLTDKAISLLPPNLSFLAACSSSALHFNSWKHLSPRLQSRLPMPLPFEMLRGAATSIIEEQMKSSLNFAKNDQGYLHGVGIDRNHGNHGIDGNDSALGARISNSPLSDPQGASTHPNHSKMADRSSLQSNQARHIPRIRFDSWIQETLTRETVQGFLPDEMEYLDVTLATNLKFPYAASLPSGLRELYLPITSPVYSLEFAQLPRDLEILFIGDAQHTCLKPGAASLERVLENAAIHFKASVLPRKTSCSIHSMHYGQLPRKLKHLVIQTWTKNEEKDLKDLPPLLQTLVLSPESSLSHGFFKSLPRSLTHLDLSTSPFILDPDIAELPNSVTFLNLARSSNLTDHCLPLLPSPLKTFICSKSRHFTGLGLKRLPRGLTCLNLDRAIKLTDASIASLPSTLTSLSLRWSSNLTDACAPILPRNLHTFKATHNTSLSSACLPLLPPSLTRFEAAFTKPYDLISGSIPIQRRFNPSALSKLKRAGQHASSDSSSTSSSSSSSSSRHYTK